MQGGIRHMNRLSLVKLLSDCEDDRRACNARCWELGVKVVASMLYRISLILGLFYLEVLQNLMSETTGIDTLTHK